jgi:hypothetical protein
MSPLETKQTDSGDVAGRRERVVTPARVAVYLHLAVVVVTAALAWLDRTGRLPDEHGLIGLVLGGLMWASFLALLACPLTAVLAFVQRPSWRAADACFAEFGLVVAQVVALWPMVSC